jgi:hypothetical protein
LLGPGARVRAGRLARPRLWDDVLLGVGGAAISSRLSPADNDRRNRLSASSVSAKVCDDGFDGGGEKRGLRS